MGPWAFQLWGMSITCKMHTQLLFENPINGRSDIMQKYKRRKIKNLKGCLTIRDLKRH